MAAFNQTRFNSTNFNSGSFLSTLTAQIGLVAPVIIRSQGSVRSVSIAVMAITTSLVQSFRPPRRMAQSAKTRIVERF